MSWKEFQKLVAAQYETKDKTGPLAEHQKDRLTTC